MAPPPVSLVQLLEPWSQVYSKSKVLPTVIVFAHVAALVFAGGLAVTIDRGTFRAFRDAGEQRTRHLGELAGAHRLVLRGLALSVVSGLLMFTADLETYWSSWVWWTKATLIVLLLANGYLMTRAEAELRKSPPESEAAWKRLRLTAMVSLVLWFAIAFAGVALVEAG